MMPIFTRLVKRKKVRRRDGDTIALENVRCN
jgi:hypothetical protein